MLPRRLVLLALAVVAAALGLVVGVRKVSERADRAELERARRDLDSNRFERARSRLETLAGRHPGWGEAVYLWGRCEAARGRLDRAIAIWSGVMFGTRWWDLACRDSAWSAQALGRLAEAESLYRRLLTTGSSQTEFALKNLLILLGQQGRLSEARAVVEEAWNRASAGTPRPADQLALIHLHAGLDLEPFPLEWNATQLGRMPSAGTPDDQRALALARANLAVQSGDLGRARSELAGMAAATDPGLSKSILELAMAADCPELAARAMRVLTTADLTPAEFDQLEAWLSRLAADRVREQAALERRATRPPADAQALARLGELLLAAGEHRRAQELNRRKNQLDRDRDRYQRLYDENRYANHLPELAELAERLGRSFEARAFRLLAGGSAQPLAAASSELVSQGPKPLASVLGDLLSQALAASSAAGPQARLAGCWFVDRAVDAGLAQFVLDNGVSSNHQLPEMSSGGVALLDYDGDGLIDVYCVQGGPFPPDPARPSSGDRLFRNRGDGRFDDVTHSAGIDQVHGYGHGVAVGDYDNDGWPDLFLTRWRSYVLLHNTGGRFEDRTRVAGLGGDRDWPTSAAFADFDDDGDLDLYVGHYGAWDEFHPHICKDPSRTMIVTCHPRSIPARPDHLFRNDGGRFVDISQDAGIVDPDGRSLGVLAADLDGDRLVDIFVANDSTANYFFRNLGSMRFEESALSAGVAASAQGGYQAGMGIARGDLDGDGRLDLLVTNFLGESTTFFQNVGDGLFADHTTAIGLAAPSRSVLGFGAVLFDANNDGRLELMTANGHVSDARPLFPYAMKVQLYERASTGKVVEIAASSGPAFEPAHVGRALAVGDLDYDGRLDAIMTSYQDPLVYLHNETRSANHFLGLWLEGTRSNRDAIGASVIVRTLRRTYVLERYAGGSFQSSQAPQLHVGLGDETQVTNIEIHWPSGLIERHAKPAVDRVYHIREGDPSWHELRPPIRSSVTPGSVPSSKTSERNHE